MNDRCPYTDLHIGAEYTLSGVLQHATSFEKKLLTAAWDDDKQFAFLSQWNAAEKHWEAVFVVLGKLLLRLRRDGNSFVLVPTDYTVDNLRIVDVDLDVWGDAIGLADSLPRYTRWGA